MPGIRVIAGVAKGRRLKMVPGQGTRPVMDRVKQAVFNIIGGGIEGAAFLDLFGGTGSVGIEALSRGAALAVFVDSDRLAVKTIHENLDTTGLAGRGQVLRRDSLAYLRAGQATGFDYIYIAPPQYQGLWAESLQAIDSRPGWLNPDGWAIAQIHPAEYTDLQLARVVLIDQRKYGSTLINIYELPGT